MQYSIVEVGGGIRARELLTKRNDRTISNKHCTGRWGTRVSCGTK